MSRINNLYRVILSLGALFTLVIQATGQTQKWSEPEFFHSLIENHPECYRRVYYYFDRGSGTEYNRIQFSAEKDKLNGDELRQAQEFYDNLYSEASRDVRKGEKYTLSQYLAADSISYTINASLAGSLDIGPTTIEVDLGNRQPGVVYAKQPDFSKLEKAISTFTSRSGVTATKVKYTGFKGGYLFVFHRGSGKGWTSGTRYTIRNASREDFESLREIIRSFIGSRVPVTVFDRTWLTMIKNENGPQFYAVGYDPDTHTLNILKATVENEICIPALWQTLDYLSD